MHVVHCQFHEACSKCGIVFSTLVDWTSPFLLVQPAYVLRFECSRVTFTGDCGFRFIQDALVQVIEQLIAELT